MDEQANLGELFAEWYLTARHTDLYQLFCDHHYAKERMSELETVASAAWAVRVARGGTVGYSEVRRAVKRLDAALDALDEKEGRMNKTNSGAWLSRANKFIREWWGTDSVGEAIALFAREISGDTPLVECMATAMAMAYREDMSEKNDRYTTATVRSTWTNPDHMSVPIGMTVGLTESSKEVRAMTDLEEFVSTYVEWLPGITWPEALALAEERDRTAAYELEQSVLAP